MTRQIYSGEPVTVIIEATNKVIGEHNLNTFNGEEYDRIENVISIEESYYKGVTITSCRSIEAYHKGLPNAGRGEWNFPHADILRVFIDGEVVYGPPVVVIAR
jgi:hypothetical protein